MTKKNIICVVGTRPEAIKMAPIILALKNEYWANVRVLVTAQHRDMLDQVLHFFNIKPDIDFNVMQENQRLSLLTSKILVEFDSVLSFEKPDAVLAQGDTTTVMATALACFYHRVPFGHVEAGLRTWNIQNPFPEETNRVITARLAQWHFAPTEKSRKNLLNEGIQNAHILVTGNSIIDALFMTREKKCNFSIPLDNTKRLILVTAHRRENFGQPFLNICDALIKLAANNQDIQILYPVHPNPNIKNIAYALLSHKKNIILCDPLEYPHFIAAMEKAFLIITDSGGVQEEAPALGKPVLVVREETERPEAVEMGVVKVIGTCSQKIVEETQLLLNEKSTYQKMARGGSPYGDGNASQRIVKFLRDYFATCHSENVLENAEENIMVEALI